MPAMIVSPVSSSVVTCSVGSSRRKRCRALLSRSAPSRVIGAMAMRMTGSGTNMFCSVQ